MDFKGGSDSDVAEEFDEEYSSDSEADGENEKEPTPKKERVNSSKSKDAPAKKKAKKDPNAPKKSLTSFIIFSSDKRKEIVNANPGMSIGDVAKQLGALWKEISASEKEKYEKLAQKDKGRYEREMAEYKKNGAAAPSSKLASKSESKSDSKPESKLESSKFKSEDVIESDDSD